MRDNPVIIDLVTRAAKGDKDAWNGLVERFSPLIWSICRKYRLSDPDAEDVGQSVWLQLLDQLTKIRDPAALPGWLVTVTRRECLRVKENRQKAPTAYLTDPEIIPDEQSRTAEEELLAAERNAALLEALAALPLFGRQLITLLLADPPVSYTDISARLGIPIGSIGPTRSRCVEKIRHYPAVAALISAQNLRRNNNGTSARPATAGALPGYAVLERLRCAVPGRRPPDRLVPAAQAGRPAGAHRPA